MTGKLLLNLFLVLVCESSFAQEPAKPEYGVVRCSATHKDKCQVILQKDAKAPFEGILYTYPLAAELAVKADPERQKRNTEAEVDHQKKLDAVELDYEKALHKIDNDACKEKLLAAEKAMKPEKVPWWEAPLFVIPVTVVITVGALWATSEMYSKIRE